MGEGSANLPTCSKWSEELSWTKCITSQIALIVFLAQALLSRLEIAPSRLIQNTSCLLDLMAFQSRLFATLAIVLGVSGDASLHDCAGACAAQHVALVQRHASYASMNQSVDQTSLGQSLCSQAQVLGNTAGRLSSSPAAPRCDNTMNGGTFKFPGGLGVLAQSDPSTGQHGGQYCCGTYAPGWFTNAPNYDSMYQYQVITGTACFSYQGQVCHWASVVSVIKCGDNDFAFTLANPPVCNLGYVWEQRTASPTAYPTALPTPSPTNSPTSYPTSSPTSYPTKSPTHDVACQSWCEGDSRAWAAKCGFNACGACDNCADTPGQLKPGGQFCDDWCKYSSVPWAKKCTFKQACGDCTGC